MLGLYRWYVSQKKEKSMRRIVIILVLIAVLLVILLHACPPFELWLHQITGWH